jgi:CheY-like chemotaxis protein
MKILIVDDEPLVRRTLARVLSDHELTVVADGNEALVALRENADIALILCDMLMPDMTGMELYVAASKVRDDLQERFVFVTGGTLTTEVQTFVATVDNAVLRKPFTVATLRDIVERFG